MAPGQVPPIYRVQDLVKEEQTRMLIYGPPGVGKTQLSGTSADVPEMQKVLDLNVDGGVVTIRNKQIDVWTINNGKDFGEAYQYLYAGGHGYSTLLVDRLDELATLGMQEWLASMAAKDPSRDADLAEGTDYNKVQSQMRRVIGMLRRLPMGLICTAHSKVEETTGWYVPAFSGKLARDSAGYFDIVGFMMTYESPILNEQGEPIPVVRQNKQLTRRLITDVTSTCVAKDRWGVLGAFMDDPTIPRIVNLLRGGGMVAPGSNGNAGIV